MSFQFDEKNFLQQTLCGEERNVVQDVTVVGSYVAMIYFAFKVFEQFAVSVSDMAIGSQIPLSSPPLLRRTLPFVGGLAIMGALHYLIRTQTKVCQQNNASSGSGGASA